MKKRKIAILALAVVLAAGLLAGCGKSETEDELAQIQASGKIVVGVEGTYPPVTYHDDNGNLTGFDIDVANAVADKLGVKAEFVESDWDSLLAGVDSKRFDTVINAVSITDERKEKYDFAGPYFYITRQIVVKTGNEDIKSLNDLNGKKVATNATNDYAETLEKLGATIVPIDTSDEAADLVLSGRADFCMFNDTIFGEYIKQHPDAQLTVAFRIPDEVETIGIPVRKGETKLYEAIQNALTEIEKDGTLAKLSEKYFGADYTSEPKAGQ